MKNFLFICSRNEWRSRTVEAMFRNDTRFNIKSAGTSKTARVKVSNRLITWSDHIFVMEDHHKRILEARFGDVIKRKEVSVLNIPDEYKYLDQELVDELRDVINNHFEKI